MSTRTLTIVIPTILAIGIAVIAVAASEGPGPDEATNRAPLVEKIPYHESAIEIVEDAAQAFAGGIASRQGAETENLERIHRRVLDQRTREAEPGASGNARSSEAPQADK
jgi:hypothetical protein